jgi:hypothetical protein
LIEKFKTKGVPKRPAADKFKTVPRKAIIISM